MRRPMHRKEGIRLLPRDTVAKWQELEADEETQGQYALVAIDGFDEEGEPIVINEEAAEELAGGAPGQYAIIKLETGKLVHQCFVNDRGERVRGLSRGSRTVDPAAAMARQSVFVSEAWGQLSADQKETIRELKTENKLLRRENDALKDELREATMQESELGEVLDLGKEFIAMWQSSSFREKLATIANTALPQIVEIVGHEKAAEVARVLMLAAQAQELELPAAH